MLTSDREKLTLQRLVAMATNPLILSQPRKHLPSVCLKDDLVLRIIDKADSHSLCIVKPCYYLHLSQQIFLGNVDFQLSTQSFAKNITAAIILNYVLFKCKGKDVSTTFLYQTYVDFLTPLICKRNHLQSKTFSFPMLVRLKNGGDVDFLQNCTSNKSIIVQNSQNFPR